MVIVWYSSRERNTLFSNLFLSFYSPKRDLFRTRFDAYPHERAREFSACEKVMLLTLSTFDTERF